MKLLNSLPLLPLITACFSQPFDGPAASEVTSSLEKRDHYAWIGQYSTDDCTKFPVVNATKWHPPPCTDSNSYCVPEARPKLYSGTCFPWYPVLTAENGPSVGVSFGSGGGSVSKVHFYKPRGVCTLGQEWGVPSCCDDEDLSHYLGSMNAKGKSDFGATDKLGLKGMCAQIGSQPGANQTLWEARYVMAT